MTPQKKQRKEFKKLMSNLKEVVNIFFADAKQTWQRAVCVFSALFWTWLEFSFLRFIGLMVIAIGAYAGSNNIEFTIQTLRDNQEFVNLFMKVFFVLVFVLRVPIHYKKKLNKPIPKQ